MAAGVRDVDRRGCLALLWRLTRREGIRLFDLVGFERTRFVRDTLLGFALIPASLVFILGGVYAAGWLLYRTLTPPYLFAPLPLPAALYGVLVFPFIWGLTEQCCRRCRNRSSKRFCICDFADWFHSRLRTPCWMVRAC